MAGTLHARVRTRGRAVVAAIVVAGIVLSTIAALIVHARVSADVDTRLRAEVDRVVERLRLEMQRYVNAGVAASVIVRERPWLSVDEYRGSVHDLAERGRLPAFRALNFTFRVPGEERTAFELRQRAMGQASFEIRPDGQRDEYAPITYVYPVEGNEPAIGFDTLTAPLAAPAMRSAARTGEPHLSEALRLVQESGDQTGVVAYVPVDDLGWINVVFRGQDFLDAVVDVGQGVTLRVTDATPDGERTIGTIGSDVPDRTPAIHEHLELFHQRWSLEAWAVGGLATPLELAVPWLSLAAGLMITAAAALTFRTVAHGEQRATALAEQRTEALVAANAELGSTNEALVRANRAKDEFLAIVSHEFRTPLTVIRGFASTTLTYGDIDDGLRDALDRIHRNAGRLDDLVGDLLMAAKLEAGAVDATARPLRLVTAVSELRHELGAIGEVDDILVDPDLFVMADPVHVRRILTNLLSNAAKYGAPPVRVAARRMGERVEVCVTDGGAGVPDDLVASVFDRFTQAETDNRRRSQGVGLGLSIVRQLAELNHGTVRYDPEPGGGACFVVDLPYAPPDAVAAPTTYVGADPAPVASTT